LSDWSPGDDPWTEHAKYFPKCEFLILDQGSTFIANCAAEETKNDHEEDDIDRLLSNDIIREVLRLQPTDRDTLKSVLRSRQNSTGKPFDNLAELLDSMSVATSSRDSLASQSSSSVDDGNRSSCDIKSPNSSAIQAALHTSPARPRLPQVANLAGSTASSLSPVTSDTESEAQTPSEAPDAFVCKICFDSRLGVLFVPCGHFCACSQCAVALSSCPVCRSSIQKKLSTIF
jgi:hypothetical protein